MDRNENKIVGRLAEILALSYGYPHYTARQIRIAASLHDIGKQKIPPEIVGKPGKLTADEFEIMKKHTIIGAELLGGMEGSLGKMAREICLNHHEWHNGGGYWGRRLDDLPDFVQFVAISDVFTALLSERVYKQPWPPHEATAYIQKQAGTQFSPELVEVFLWLVQHDKRVSALFR
ncbi:HD domain-containing protein [Ruminococcaceae bacterium OttesenSCG-928-L11]|nr:HD domain-containing protein [Ruminococcaceae bacterium OttesenSCG-928-L11]